MRLHNPRMALAALLAALAIAACGTPDAPAPQDAPAAPTVQLPPDAPASIPTKPEVPAAEPAQAASPEATAPADWTQTVTQEGDYWVLGNPAASLRLIDYSDFL